LFAKVPVSVPVGDGFKVTSLARIAELIPTERPIVALCSLSLIILASKCKWQDRTGAYRDNLKKLMPACCTAMQCLYYAGVLLVKGYVGHSQVYCRAPARCDVVAFLGVENRLAFAEESTVEKKREAQPQTRGRGENKGVSS